MTRRVQMVIKPSFIKKTDGNLKTLRRNADREGKDLAQATHSYAREIAPKQSGQLREFIRIKAVSGEDATYFSVIAENPTIGGRHRATNGGRYGGDFNLVKWMHETDGVLRSDNNYLLAVTNGRLGHAGQRIIKSGDPRFMYTAKGYAMKKRNELVRSGKLTKGLVK